MNAFNYNATYVQTLIELKNRIENDFGSVKAFCDATGIDRPNLVRAFSKENNKDMSVGLYIRCAIALNLMEKDAIGDYKEDAQLFNLTLRNFLKIDTVAVWRSMFFVAARQADPSLSQYDAAYLDTITGLKAAILKKFGNVKAFCDVTGLDRPNLSRAFSSSNDKDVSVGLYIRCVVGLGLMPKSAVDSEDDQLLNLTLRNYLKIDTMAVWRSILSLANPE
jgi:DNA-binding phage protein